MSNVHHLSFGTGEIPADGAEYAAEGLNVFVMLLMTDSNYVEELIAATEQ